MPSVSIVYRKDKLNKKNEAPVHFRIIKDRKISYVTAGFMLKLDEWDFDKNKVKSKHPNSQRFNSYLSHKYTELQDQVFEHETLTKSNTSKQLKSNVFGKKPVDFFPFATQQIAIYETEGRVGTYDKNKAIIEKLRNYIGSNSLTFQDITPDFLDKYQTYLKVVLKNKTNTCNNSFKFINQMFKKAYSLDLIEHNLNPFNRFKIKEEKTQRNYLTEEELQKVIDYKTVVGSRMEVHKDMFVFASYTGGIRVSDMLQLKWQNFDGSNLNITMRKTGGQVSIKVPNAGLSILDKYRTNESKPTDYIFPILHNTLNIDDAREVDNAISNATAYLNKNLAYIAKKIELNKQLSFHISRHTWATRALRKGISIDKVSKLMGHSQLRETQIYAKIVNEELDKAMDAFN
jgi:integrase